MEQVYQYLTGIKFRQRVEAVIEKFNDMREDLDREREVYGQAVVEERGADPGGCQLYGRNGGRPAGHRRQGYARDSQPRHAVARGVKRYYGTLISNLGRCVLLLPPAYLELTQEVCELAAF